jgi:hypothetical protein
VVKNGLAAKEEGQSRVVSESKGTLAVERPEHKQRNFKKHMMK